MRLIPVILAGGSGTRLWPVSRPEFPKQFSSLTQEDLSLFQLTCQRLSSSKRLATRVAEPLVITNEAYRFIIERTLAEIGVSGSKIVLEPQQRSTAPAIALMAHLIANEYSADDLMLVLPADAFIEEPQRFADYVADAADFLTEASAKVSEPAQKPIGTFGVKPLFPHTGYGYIKAGKAGNADAQAGTEKEVEAFVEKPDQAKAAEYIKHGGYFWNCGIFMFSASAYLARLEKLAPEILKATGAAMKNPGIDGSFIRPAEKEFAKSPNISIDYAVMEKTKNIYVLPMELNWSDVGSWKSVSDLYAKDADGNSQKANAVMRKTKDSFVYSSRSAGQRLITTLGVSGLAIVDTPDALLVANKDESEDVRGLVETLMQQKHPQAEEQYRSYRPWGWYESLIKREGFQVKRLAVYPSAKLSLQSHKHRSEHWVVVCGTALVTRDEEEISLKTNESIYIPLGAKHRLANPGKELLEVIEVQNGDYLGEDDIVRYEDIYSRS